MTTDNRTDEQGDTDILQWLNTTESKEAEHPKDIIRQAERLLDRGKTKVAKALAALPSNGVQTVKPSFLKHHCKMIESGRLDILEATKAVESATYYADIAYLAATNQDLYGALREVSEKKDDTGTAAASAPQRTTGVPV